MKNINATLKNKDIDTMRPGYWTEVFKQAATLIEEKKIDGTSAFKMARNIVDDQSEQIKLKLERGEK